MRRFLLPLALLGAFLVPALVPAPASAAGTLTVVIVGKGTVSGSGISCSEAGGVCSVSTQSATLSGAPGPGYAGPGWEGCSLAVPLLNQCWELSVDGDKTITAVFTDVQAPVIRSITPPTGSTVAGTVDVTADVVDNSGTVARVRFYVNGTRWGNDDTQAPFVAEVFTPPFADQQITVEVEAFDDAENATGRTSVTYQADNTPPETEILKAPAKRMVVRNKRALVSFQFSSSEDGSRFECSLDNYSYEDCGRKQDWKLKAGKHVLRVVAFDAAGSPDLTPAVYKWKIIQRAKKKR
jgi:hypothetical protein